MGIQFDQLGKCRALGIYMNFKLNKPASYLLALCALSLPILYYATSGNSRETTLSKIDKLEHAQLELEKLDIWIEKLNSSPFPEPWINYQRASYFSDQAMWMSVLELPEDQVNAKHALAVEECERVLTKFPQRKTTSTLAAILLLKESLPLMTSPTAYANRARMLKGEVDLRMGQDLVSTLLEVSNAVCHGHEASQNNLVLAVNLLDLAMDDQWYPASKESHVFYHQALIQKGEVLVRLNQLDEAQELHDLQLALNPEYFPNMRNALRSNIDCSTRNNSEQNVFHSPIELVQ